MPNPGRMEELLIPGETVGIVVLVAGPNRATAWDLVAVEHSGRLVSIDSRIANRLVARALAGGTLRAFGGGRWSAEVPWGGRRFDFGVRGAVGRLPESLLEVKSSNLRVGTTMLFPDAPTKRGTRQVRTLTTAARQGVRTGVLFALQSEGAREFRPNAHLDPEFAAALARARSAGVRVAARTMKVRPWGVAWGPAVPVRPPFP